MNEYEILMKALAERVCPVCNGHGTQNDAGQGDMYCNTCACTNCNGTGLKPTYQRTPLMYDSVSSES